MYEPCGEFSADAELRKHPMDSNATDEELDDPHDQRIIDYWCVSTGQNKWRCNYGGPHAEVIRRFKTLDPESWDFSLTRGNTIHSPNNLSGRCLLNILIIASAVGVYSTLLTAVPSQRRSAPCPLQMCPIVIRTVSTPYLSHRHSHSVHSKFVALLTFAQCPIQICRAIIIRTVSTT